MNFAVLCVGQGLGIMAFEMGTPYLPALLGGLGVKGAASLMLWSGWSESAALFLGLLSAPLWARLGDRTGRKAMLIRAHLGLGAALLWLAYARNPWEVLLARAFQGALAGITAAAFAMVSQDERAASRMAWLQSSSLAGALIGPFIGAFILRHTLPATIFLVGAMLCVISVFLTEFFVVTPLETAPMPSEASSRSSFSPLAPAAIAAAWIFAWRALEDPVLPVYIRQIVPTGADWALWTAVILGASRATAVLAGPLWGRLADRFTTSRLLIAAIIGAAILTAAQFLAPTAPHLLAVRAMLGLFTGALASNIYAIAAQRSPLSRRGEAVALAVSGGRLGDCIGSAFGGVLAALLGVPGLFLTMAGGLLTSLFFTRQKNNLEKQTCAENSSTGTSYWEPSPAS